MMKAEQRIQWILDAKSNEELMAHYDEWSRSYEEDMLATFSYTAPAHLLAILARYVAQDAQILDAAAGTGLIGQAMYRQGYRNLTALDMSKSMLRVAREKQVYQAFALGVLGETLNLPSNAFDTVVSIGVFTVGYAPASDEIFFMPEKEPEVGVQMWVYEVM